MEIEECRLGHDFYLALGRRRGHQVTAQSHSWRDTCAEIGKWHDAILRIDITSPTHLKLPRRRPGKQPIQNLRLSRISSSSVGYV